MTRAKDPGLGVRGLHEQGITGSGAGVAIIDGKLRTDHFEYRDQLAYYEEISNFEGIPYEVHGPSVASILVGKQIGIAPGAKLYYFSQNFAEATPTDVAETLRHILTFNKSLPEGQRIRMVSISTGWPAETGEIDQFKTAVDEAWQEDVFVLHNQYPTYTQTPFAIRGVGCPPWKDRDDPQNYGIPLGAKAYLRDRNLTTEGYLKSRAQIDRDNGYVTLYVPTDFRTLAGPRVGEGGQGYGPQDYYYEAEGGDSWWPPYASGVLALALQVNPKLTSEDMAALLAEGVYELENGMRLIAPEKIVEQARRFSAP